MVRHLTDKNNAMTIRFESIENPEKVKSIAIQAKDNVLNNYKGV